MEREEKKEIVVKERENILILFPCLNITLMTAKKVLKKWVEFKKMSRGGIFFLGGHNIYSCRTY